MKPKYIYIAIISFISILFNLIILIFPEITIKSTVKGLLLWYNSALPALLPFIISINLLKHTYAPVLISKTVQPITKKLFKISGIGVFPIVMGMLSGYPLGAKLTCELYKEKRISKQQAQHLIMFTNNSGPLFVIGTVGTIFLHSKSAGYFILIIHYLSAIISGIVTRPKKSTFNNEIKYTQTNCSISSMLSETIIDSIHTIVTIGGYIILFSIITGYITNFISEPFIKGIIYGMFEITGGCSILAEKSRLGLSLISALISWGGLSIHAQASGYISSANLSVCRYILTKIFQALTAFLICMILYPIYAQKLS